MFDGPDFTQPDANGNYPAGNLTRTWILFFEQTSGGGYQGLDRVTFGLGINANQPVGNDLTTHGQKFTDGVLIGAYGNAKTPPSTTPLYLDILRSTDQGVTWNSIFLTGGTADANKLVIPAGDSKRQIQSNFNVTTPPGPTSPQGYNVYAGDWWRIDLLTGSGTDAQNINVVVLWAVSSIQQSIIDTLALKSG